MERNNLDYTSLTFILTTNTLYTPCHPHLHDFNPPIGSSMELSSLKKSRQQVHSKICKRGRKSKKKYSTNSIILPNHKLATHHRNYNGHSLPHQFTHQPCVLHSVLNEDDTSTIATESASDSFQSSLSPPEHTVSFEVSINNSDFVSVPTHISCSNSINSDNNCSSIPIPEIFDITKYIFPIKCLRRSTWHRKLKGNKSKINQQSNLTSNLSDSLGTGRDSPNSPVPITISDTPAINPATSSSSQDPPTHLNQATIVILLTTTF